NEKYDVAGLGTVLNEGEVELYYHNQIKWLWEDSELNGDKVVHGYLYAIAGYIVENCSSVDEHGNRLKLKDLESIFDNLFGQPGYSKVLAHLGGGWSKSVPFHCEDACAGVDVELAVFDYCCNFGIGSSKAYVEDKSSVKLVRQLPDLDITCEAYNVYYKDIVEGAAALGENGSENDENGVFAAMNDVFGYYLTSYVDNQGRAVDKEGNLLSESDLNFDYYNISCGEESQTEQVAVIGHDGIIDWVNKVSTTTYLDTTLHSSINGVVSINCSAMSIQDVWVDLDECDQGTITRRFIIRDGCGSAGSGMTFEQVINVASACGLRESMFDLPEDLGTQDGPICLPEALSDSYFPDTIGRLTLKPELEGVLCNLVAIGKQVKSYDVVGAPTMKKYEITWIMSDWCGTKTSSTKELTYTQVVVATIDPACNVDDNTGDVSLVSGQIKTELGSAVSGVDVKAVLGQWSPIKLSTSESGDYSFSLEKGSDLTIVPSKNTGFSNGISTADIIDILSHVLQKNELDSKYKRIAADVNGNGQIEALDVLELRKLVLNPRGVFANNTSWRFFESKTDNEVYEINPLIGDERVDFTAVKVGDVNLSSDPASSNRSVTGNLNLNMSDKRLKGGEIYHIDVRSDNFDAIRGLQYTLNYADAYVSVESILPGALKMTEDNYLKYRPGVLTASWNDSEGMSAGADEVLFTIVVKAKSEALLRDILTLNDLVTKTEAYGDAGELRDIHLRFNGDGGKFALYQNRPNPYKGETIIGFVLPESGEAVMTIYNVSGRLMKTVKGDYSAGYNEVRIRSTEIGGSGVLYYQLTTDKHTATKKMIVVD
uniref:T9SS type A sorting domain-containing protein n=1 Tax=Membranihabitans marinus TaxID=1227546 RepID=UPI001F440653